MSLESKIWLAEKWCIKYHEGQKRKGGIQKPYDTHPFAVREILARYGYNDEETQITALLHDTIEDTDLGKKKKNIEKIFGKEIYSNVYALSNNTIGSQAEYFEPLYNLLGVKHLDESRIKVTPQAYKLRILDSPDTVKRVKIADMIHNTSDLNELDTEGITKKLEDAEFYIAIGKRIAPFMVEELEKNILTYKNSTHYKEIYLKAVQPQINLPLL